MSFKTWMIDLKKNKVKDSKASSLSLWRVFGFTLTEFQRKIQTHISWSVIWIHLIFQNLSKSVQQNTSCFQPGVGRAKWAGEAPKYMHNSTANFWWTKQNPNLTIYAKLCSNHITHVHGKSSKTVLKHQGNTTLSGNMQTYTQSPTFGQVLKGSILKAVCFVGANSFSSHRVRIVRQLVRRNSEAWQVSALYMHTYPANSTQKSSNQAQNAQMSRKKCCLHARRRDILSNRSLQNSQSN